MLSEGLFQGGECLGSSSNIIEVSPHLVIPVQLLRLIRLCVGESKELPDLQSDDADGLLTMHYKRWKPWYRSPEESILARRPYVALDYRPPPRNARPGRQFNYQIVRRAIGFSV